MALLNLLAPGLRMGGGAVASSPTGGYLTDGSRYKRPQKYKLEEKVDDTRTPSLREDEEIVLIASSLFYWYI